MFQFRRFPAYTYLIQCMLTEYCSAGFPHSEISGSQLICSSPKLIAACRVLHRLLMPRHSPCALSSLTSSALAPYPSLPNLFASSLTSQRLLPKTNEFVFERLVHLTSCSQNYAGFTEEFLEIVFTLKLIKSYTFACGLSTAPSVALLAFISLCSVFKVQKKERTHCPKAFAIVQSCVPSKLNNVRQKRSDLGRLWEWLPTCLLRKEVIQPHLPIRLPCYDFTPITKPTFGRALLAVRLRTSGVPGSHGVTGGVYKARERIHRGMLIRDY